MCSVPPAVPGDTQREKSHGAAPGAKTVVPCVGVQMGNLKLQLFMYSCVPRV